MSWGSNIGPELLKSESRTGRPGLTTPQANINNSSRMLGLNGNKAPGYAESGSGMVGPERQGLRNGGAEPMKPWSGKNVGGPMRLMLEGGEAKPNLARLCSSSEGASST